MKKYISDLLVTTKEALNNQYFLLKLTSETTLPAMLPGQFVEVLVEHSTTTFLRRPLSIHFVDTAANEMWLLVQKIGDGTRKMSEYAVGQTVNVIYPLGNTFSIPANKQKVLLVGGGVGVAPLLMLGEVLQKKGFEPAFLLGARSKSDLLELDEFAKYGEVYTTTEDGSHGEKGFVTHHSVLKEQFDKMYTCGPTPMMKAIAAYAMENNIDCEASLENTMACGIGACLCCVQDTKEGHKCVCTDGPVFNIKDLKWQI